MTASCAIHIAKEFGTDLSSRSRGASLRRSILSTAEECAEKVRLDFSGVRTLSTSFADEAFAVLIVQKGDQWFKRHVAVVSATDSIRESILSAVARRRELA